MKELVVISGKGGTGKTSLVASFAALAGSAGSRQARSALRSDSGQAGSWQAGNAVLADCDVDAADLHLVLAPTVLRREEFRCGHEAIIRQKDCIGCGACLARCRFDAIRCVTKETCDPQREHAFVIDPTACEGCGVCVWSCPVKAIDFPERLCGEWYVSDTRHGPMVHARLIPGGENSGKLVSKVREAARTLAEERKADLILVDGPPGVGCAVIASITGASQVLVVTEPTLSGAHDMARVLQLTRHFKIPTAVCVNKWDLNAEMTARIESKASRVGAMPVGRVRYGRAVTTAQMQGLTVVETDAGPLGDDIRQVWENLSAVLPPTTRDTSNKGETKTMKIAIPLTDGKLCMHFGHCEQFALLEVDENAKKVTGKRMLTPPPHEPGVLPRWLHQEGATVIIAGGMGQRAQAIFAENAIKVVVGAPAEAPEQLVAQYLAGTLVSGANVCDH